MREPLAPPRRFRRRLTVAFVLVAGLSTAALAVGSFLLVRQTRLEDSLERARRETQFNLRQAVNLSSRTDLQQFVTGYFRERGVPAKLVADGREYVATPRVNPPIPSGLQRLVRRGQIAYQRIDVEGTPYLAMGGRPAGSGVELYFFFSEAGLQRDLSELRTALVAGWVVVVAAAALVGRLVARRTLGPVAAASRAAGAVAEGLLSTRLPETEDEFGAWAASFNEMARALESKISALLEAEARERRFTSDVAHELRTPLTALVGEAGLLKEYLDRMPPDVRRPAELLVADVARLRRTVEDLMEISRLDAGREVVETRAVDLRALVDATIRSRGWRDRVRLEAQEAVLASDPRRIERIVSNLVGNAVEHGGGGVTVTVASDAESAVIEVADRGPGIPPEDLPHVFERFYKADRARGGTGSGLGLSIARENARLLGGDIEVWSEPEAGSRFTLRLPVPASLPGGDGVVAPPGHDEGGSPDQGGKP